MGEVEYAPGEPKGTPWHPHRGFETVTYIIDGVFDHQDSHGGGGTITNGDTQWMTAGSGILHIETPPEWLVQSGGLFHGIQLWVNLPARREDGRAEVPGHPRPARSPCSRRTTRARCVRVIAGDVGGHRPARARRTPRWRWCTRRSSPGARLDLPWQPGLQRARLRARRPRHGRHRRAPGPAPGQPAVLRRRRLPHGRRADGSQESRSPQLDVIVRRRQADRPAARLGRPVRDEHQGRGAAGLRGLPGRPARPDPRRRHPARTAADPGGAAVLRTARRSAGGETGGARGPLLLEPRGGGFQPSIVRPARCAPSPLGVELALPDLPEPQHRRDDLVVVVAQS